MHEEFEDAKFYGRYDKKRECYINKNGDPVVHKREMVYKDVLADIPLSDEYYSNVTKDKTYLKRLDKIIRDVMTTSLKKRDKERMKKNVDELVKDLKKVAEKEKKEDKGADDVEVESLVEVDDADEVGEEQQKSEADQTQTAKKVEVPITEVNTSTESFEVLNKTDEQCKKCIETCSACTEKDEKFRTRDLEFTKIEKVFKEKCKEMLENEKVLKG
ncbi:hypothetical protein Hanom_Chr15g01411431 [Helianthus anomalus]